MSNCTVNLWGSNPDAENDDCWTGLDFATREEALAAFRGNARDLKLADALTEGEWLEIDGPDINETRPLTRDEWQRSRREARLDDSLAASEALWEGRMLHGLAWED